MAKHCLSAVCEAAFHASSTRKESSNQTELREGLMKNSGPASSMGVIKLLIISGLQFYPGREASGVFQGII